MKSEFNQTIEGTLPASMLNWFSLDVKEDSVDIENSYYNDHSIPERDGYSYAWYNNGWLTFNKGYGVYSGGTKPVGYDNQD